MWYIALLLAIYATTTTSVAAQKEDEPIVFLVRVPDMEELDDDSAPLEAFFHPRDVYTKRAIPFNGGMYGKRAAMPFSGGMYGKRSSVGPIFAQRRAAIPFSGGMYGKRSVSAVMANNENQIKRGAMPFSGGMYGR